MTITAIIEPDNSNNKATNIPIEEKKFLLILGTDVNNKIFDIGLEIAEVNSLKERIKTKTSKGG